MHFLEGTKYAAELKTRHGVTAANLMKRGVKPQLAIIQAKDDPVIDTYVRLKKRYGQDIGAAVVVHKPKMAELPALIEDLNKDRSIHGIIVQLPLPNPTRTDTIVNLVAPGKDVDALAGRTVFEPATPMAILWLLEANNISLEGKKILLIGRGKLVGAPLEKILKKRGLNVAVVDKPTPKLPQLVGQSDIIITATSSPGVVTAGMPKSGAVIVDAGVAAEEGKTVGDVDPKIYSRQDISITPQKGGVGPLTVSALFENLLTAATAAANE